MSRLIQALRCLVLLLIVLAIAPPFVEIAGPFSLDDVGPIAAIVVALALVAFRSERIRSEPSAPGFMLVALFGLLSSAANATTPADFARLAGRSTGRVLFFLLLVLSVRAIFEHRPWVRRAVIGFVAAATAESLFCLFAFQTAYVGPYGIGVAGFADWSVLKGRLRVHGTFSGEALTYEPTAVSANFLAAYLVMSIPTTLGLALSIEDRRWRSITFASAMLQLVVLYLTYTRAALIALAASILAMGWYVGRRRLAAGIVLVGICATLAIPTVRTKFLGETHDRYALWWASLQIVRDHPFVGIGDGNYMTVLHSAQRYNDTPYGTAAATSHNSVMLAAASAGVLGGLALLLLYALMFRETQRAIRNASPELKTIAIGIAAGLVGYLVQDQFNNLAYVPKVATQMWFLFTLLPLCALRSDPPRTPARRST